MITFYKCSELDYLARQVRMAIERVKRERNLADRVRAARLAGVNLEG